MDVTSASELLGTFRQNNPHSKIEVTGPTDANACVKLPWGDTGLDILIADDDPALPEALNNLILPPRFKAIWHIDAKALEIIFTAHALDEQHKILYARKFTFEFDGRKIECEFAKSSDRLLKLAEHARTESGIYLVAPRNLGSFINYAKAERGVEDAIKIASDIPVCFWVRGLDEWSEDYSVTLAMHLNFFMTYYDKLSPTIDVLPPKYEKSKSVRPDRHIIGHFPEKIRGRQLNPVLLHFWAQLKKDDPLRRFLYAFLVVEHVSFYYVEEKIKRSLHRALSSPHVYHELEGVIVEIMDHVSTQKTWEGTKMNQLLRDAVDPKLLWKEIDRNKGYFSNDQTFEGGFELSGLISSSATLESWSKNWQDSFTMRFREIRNSLSHGREQSTSGVILPTAGNYSLLLPWLDLAILVAGEATLYRHTIL